MRDDGVHLAKGCDSIADKSSLRKGDEAGISKQDEAPVRKGGGEVGGGKSGAMFT